MMPLKPAQRDELLIELKTAVVGMKGTDERGLAGDIKEMKELLVIQNGRIRKNTVKIYSLTALLIGAGIIDATVTKLVFGG